MMEVNRTLQERFALSDEQIQHRESEIRRHFPEAWVDGYEDLSPVMTNQDKDRHVLAAAVRARAEVIVTYYKKDFPPSSLAPYSVVAQGPTTFLNNLYELDPPAVLKALTRQAAAIDQTLPQLLSRLRVNVPGFVNMLEEARASSEAGEVG
jgi:hypothetical protein